MNTLFFAKIIDYALATGRKATICSALEAAGRSKAVSDADYLSLLHTVRVSWLNG